MANKFCVVLILLLSLTVYASDASLGIERFQTAELPLLPDGLSIDGAFIGSVNDSVIAAGGLKDNQLTDDIYVLDRQSSQWELKGKLDITASYGVSISTPYGLMCLGGADAAGVNKRAFMLQYIDGKLGTVILPDMPQLRSYAAGALVGDDVYVAAGLDEAGRDTATLWRLKLTKNIKEWPSLKWEILEQLPGVSRSGASAAALNGKLYIFGGMCADDKTAILKDAYRYIPGHDWAQIIDIPAASAAADAAVPYGDSHIVVFAGRDIFAYHEITGSWAKFGEMSIDLRITNALKTGSGIVLAAVEKIGGISSGKILEFRLLPLKKSFGWLNMIRLIGYLVSLALIGIFYARKEKSTADYFVGGKRIPWWAAGLSIFGTQLSSIAFMAIPAKVYATDWLYFTGVITIVMVQPIVIYFYLPFFRKLKVASAYEYLEKRFNLAARLIASASFILFQTGRMTIVLFLPALALSAVTGLNIYLCIIMMGVVVTFYTAVGGIEAVVWTDVLQVVVLIGAGLVSLLIVVLNIEGGLGELWRLSMSDNKLKCVDWSWDYTKAVFWLIMLGGIFQNIISYTADQAVVQRYFVTKDFKSAANSIWSNAALVIPVSLIWFMIGTALYGFYKTHPASLDPTVKTDQIFPLFIAQELPNGIVGLVIAGLFAAAQSTISGSMNSISTVVSTDFYQRLSKNHKDSTSLNLARYTTLLLGIIATGTALWMAANQGLIVSLWDIYIAIIGLSMASVAGLFILGIFTTKTTACGALTGAAAGAVILYIFQQYTNVHFYLYSFIGVAACVVVGFTASLILPSSGKDLSGLTIYSIDSSDKN